MRKKRLNSNRLQEILEGTLSLLIVFLLLAASVVSGGKLLGYDFKALSQKTAPGVSLPTSEELVRLGIPDAIFVEQQAGVWQVENKEGERIGTLISTQQSGKDIQGYASATPLFVCLNTADTIVGIVPQANEETPDFFEEAKQVLLPFQGVSVTEAQSQQVDAVSGATLSCNALIAHLRLALATYEQNHTIPTTKAPGIGWWKAFAALFVLALGAFAHLRKKGKKKWRLVVLWLNVLVLGFGTGQFISFALLQSWVANGVDWIVVLPSISMLLLTLLLSFLGHKHHHCTWVCPYGSIQDLAYRLPLPKIKVRSPMMKRMRKLRQLTLLLLLFFAWIGGSVEAILGYEPFSAFLVTVAAPSTLVLALVFLLASMFVPQVWCRALCPVGEVLEWGTESRSNAPRTRKKTQP